MSLLQKILSAFRGGVREVGEAIVDANSTRIFEQEIRDAEHHLRQAKQDLTQVMAKEMQSQRDVERLKRDIQEHEGYASQALAQANESLALDIANKIAQLEQQLSEQTDALTSFSQHGARLKELVKKTERQLADYNRQLTMVKTTESVQKASAAITDNFASSNSKLLNAKDSLDRIRARQQDNDDRLKAAEALEAENSDQSLKARMQAAGIGEPANSAQSVLERLKAKQS